MIPGPRQLESSFAVDLARLLEEMPGVTVWEGSPTGSKEKWESILPEGGCGVSLAPGLAEVYDVRSESWKSPAATGPLVLTIDQSMPIGSTPS